jgi:4-hydroxybenzoate polyprenyltransferase
MRLEQLTRSHEWWDYKTPQVLSLAYATVLIANASMFEMLKPGFLTVFLSLVAMALYASIINDFTDLEIDLACGKSNMMQNLKPVFRLLLVLASLVVVIIAAAFIYPNIYGVIFYLLITLSISLYSFHPVRLKKRGIWGVISCASAEHLFPTLFSIAVIAFYAHFKLNVWWLIAAGTLSLMYGIRGILWHQFLDRDNDIQSNTKTFAATTTPQLFNKYIYLIMAIELIALATVLMLMNLIYPILFLGLYLFYLILQKLLFSTKVIVIISPKNEDFQILMQDYYILFLPVSLLLFAAVKQPLGWVVLVIHLLLFHQRLIVIMQDGLYITRRLFYKIKN